MTRRPTLEERARLSGGVSDVTIYRMVASAVARRHIKKGTLVDVGCGAARLWQFIGRAFDCYIGIDAVRYESFPPDLTFYATDLNSGMANIPSNLGDVVASVETIEHLENPRALVRELMRITKPGGWLIVTTPNQLSLLSILCLVVKHRFVHFQDVHYPAHLTALIEVDLLRIAHECGLSRVEVEYSGSGRIPLTPWHYPQLLSKRLARTCSDNLLLVGQKPSR